MIKKRIKKLMTYLSSTCDGAMFNIAAKGYPVTLNEKRLLSLKDSFKGRRAFILANGPSLNKVDIGLLKDELTIGCNGIFLMFDKMAFLPTFYTVEDVLVAEDRADWINSIKGTTKIFPKDLNYCLRPDSDTIFINFIRSYAGAPKFTNNFERIVYWGGTVTFLNMQLAYYLGCREVYLIGADHNYMKPAEDDEVDRNIIKSNSQDRSHFHPHYFGPGFRYHDPKVDRMEKSYLKAKEYFEKNDGIIFNATLGGKLDVFERISFESLF